MSAAAAALAWIASPWLRELPGLSGLSDMGISMLAGLALFIVPAGASQPGTLPENGVLVDVGTFDSTRLHEVRVNPADVGARIAALGANGFNIPSLLGVGTSAPYYHDGIAPTLDAALNGSADGFGASTLRTIHRVVDAAQRARLIEFLESIDGDTVTPP